MSQDANSSPTSVNEEEKTAIKKNLGVTESERYLESLCNASFLSLWSYAGVFRNQGNQGGGDGKEVADLLVVFDGNVIIFSDKHCDYPCRDEDVAWPRWFKSAIRKAADQVFGAERWIRDYPDRLFLDRACTSRFPLDLSDIDRFRFFRIVVAHGASDACRKYFGGGSGSLVINPSILGSAHFEGPDVQPFSVGIVDPAKAYVHVFDDTSLHIVLSTLDTAADFFAYLEKKERFITAGKLGLALGEEELLANYLSTMNDCNDHDFPEPPEGFSQILFGEGLWDEFRSRPERLRQLDANFVSYLWDEIIERFCQNAIDGTLLYTSRPGIANVDAALGFLAAERRTRRRMLSDSLVELLQNGKGARSARIVAPSSKGDPHYVFVLLEVSENHTYEHYREARRSLLIAYCHAVKLVCPEAEDIVGIATETAGSDGRSEDVVHLDARFWDVETDDYARAERARLSLFPQVNIRNSRVDEYPV